MWFLIRFFESYYFRFLDFFCLASDFRRFNLVRTYLLSSHDIWWWKLNARAQILTIDFLDFIVKTEFVHKTRAFWTTTFDLWCVDDVENVDICCLLYHLLNCKRIRWILNVMKFHQKHYCLLVEYLLIRSLERWFDNKRNCSIFSIILLDNIEWYWDFWMLIEDFSLFAIFDFEFRDVIILYALRDLLEIDIKKLNRVKNTFFDQNIVLLLLALICNEEKTMKISQILECDANKAEFFVMFWMMFFMMFSKQYVINNCCATITDFIWLEILDRNSYETNCITISIEKCKSWWL